MWRSFPLLLLLVTLGYCHYVVVTDGAQRFARATSTQKNAEEEPTIHSLHIISNIKLRYATTLISARVVNPCDQSGEATFTVTLPESAFITEFLLVAEDEVSKAYVKTKDEAKAIYQGAVQAGQDAGHVGLSARDSNEFTVKVNLQAQGEVTFNLTYEQLLKRNLGVYTNIININPQQVVDDMSVIVNIEEPTDIVNLEASELLVHNEANHKERKPLAEIDEISPNHKKVSWTPTDEEQSSVNTHGLSGQFIVKYDVDRKNNSQLVIVDNGYFIHFFCPEELLVMPKHVIFVLDFSASMKGRKLKQLRAAMKKILSDLGPKDYFSIVIFQRWVDVWSPSGMYTSGKRSRGRRIIKHGVLDNKFVIKSTHRNIELACSFIEKYSDLRSTNIMRGMTIGLKLVDIGQKEWENESDPPQTVLVFLTDGQPNVEEKDTNVIIHKTKDLNTKRIPIYSLAFGYDADFNFLRKLSLQNSGFARQIYEAADATLQLKNFYQTIASPLLSNVKFTYISDQVEKSANTKQEFPVFYKGSEIVVAGRVNTDNIADDKPIGELQGVSATGAQTYPVIKHHTETKVQNRSIGNLEKMWSYLTIQQLLDKADSLDDGEDKKQTRKNALDLALKYAFVTPLTSLVVVMPDETETTVDTTQVKPGTEELFYPKGDSTDVPLESGIDPRFGGSESPQEEPLEETESSSESQEFIFPIESSSQPPNTDTRFGATSSSPPPQQTPKIDSGSEFAFPSQEQTEPYGTGPPHKQHQTPQKISLDGVKWLQEALNATTTNKSVTVEGTNYKLGTNETKSSFGDCKVNNDSGECHHLQHCALDAFQDNLSQFLPYKCHIPGDFLGVCCPKYLL